MLRWEIHHFSLIFRLKTSMAPCESHRLKIIFHSNFPLPRLITRGSSASPALCSKVCQKWYWSKGIKGPLGIKIAQPPVSDDPVLTMRKAPAEEQSLALAKAGPCNLCPCNDRSAAQAQQPLQQMQSDRPLSCLTVSAIHRMW